MKMMARQTLPVNIFDEMHMIYSHALFEELCENYHIHPNSEKKAVYFSQIIASEYSHSGEMVAIGKFTDIGERNS